jgi:hypothetical protein
MTEKHWSIVLQDSNALYGQLVVREVVKQEVEKSENSDVKKSEIPKEIILYKFKPAPYPGEFNMSTVSWVSEYTKSYPVAV